MMAHRVISTLLFQCLVTALAQEEASNPCPSGWLDATLSGMGCLFFNSTTKVQWEEAAIWCQSDGRNASLVEIWTELQLDIVRSELLVLAQNGIDDDWWIGATDQGREGSWYWANTLATVGDFIWYNPTNNDVNRNCALLENDDQFLGLQHDCMTADTSWTICQMK